MFAVIPVAGEQPLVLFNSGKYVLFDTTTFNDLKPSDFACLKENEELIWADTSASSTHIKVFCLAYSKKVTAFLYFINFHNYLLHYILPFSHVF